MKFCPSAPRSQIHGLGFLAAFILHCASGALASPTGWQGAQTIPNAIQVYTPPVAAVSDSGAAIVAWGNLSSVVTAFRSSRGGTWSLDSLGTTSPASIPAIAMNAKGDIVIAWITESFFVGQINVSYWPAGGTWGPVMIYDANSNLSDEQSPSVSINSKGDVIVGWTLNGLTAPLHTVQRTASGSWPSSPETATSTAYGTGTPFVGIDDSGNAIAVYRESYGDIQWHRNLPPPNDIEDVLELMVLRQQLKAANGSWGGASDITPRYPSVPNNGIVNCDASFTGTPYVYSPTGTVDPITGKLGISFHYYPNTHGFEPANADPFNDLPGQCANSTDFPDTQHAGFDWGTVSGGLGSFTTAGGGDSSNTVTIESTAISTDGGFGAIAWGDHDLSSSIDSISLGVGQVPVSAGSATGQQFLTSSLDVAVGGDGTAFSVASGFTASSTALTRNGSSIIDGPTTIFGVNSGAIVQADNCGNALAVGLPGGVGNAINYNDYISGKSGSQCSSAGPTPTPTPRPTPTPTPNPLTLASNLVRATTSAVSTAEKKLPAAPSRRLPKSQQDKINATRKTIATARTNLKSDESQLITLEKKSGTVIRKRVSGFTAKNLKTLQSDTNTAIGENEKRPSSAAKLWKTILSLLKKL